MLIRVHQDLIHWLLQLRQMLARCGVAAVLVVPGSKALDVCAASTQAAYKAAVCELTQVVDVPAAVVVAAAAAAAAAAWCKCRKDTGWFFNALQRTHSEQLLMCKAVKLLLRLASARIPAGTAAGHSRIAVLAACQR
jgi:hypothetical protein